MDNVDSTKGVVPDRLRGDGSLRTSSWVFAMVASPRWDRIIMEEVASVFDITIPQMVSKVRFHRQVDARSMCAWTMSERGMKPSIIGKLLQLDRSTVYNSIKHHKDMMQFNAEYRAIYAEVAARLGIETK